METLKNPRNLISMIFLAAIGVNIIISIAVIKPQTEEMLRLEHDMKFSQKGNGPAGGALSRIEEFKKRLPDKKSATSVLGGVFGSARKAGLTIPAGDYAPENETDLGAISRYTISFPVEGSYASIKRFIYELENLKYPLVVEEIVFSRSKGAERTIELKIKLSAYFV